MDIIKYIKKQDAGLKLSPTNSGETSLNLSVNIFNLFNLPITKGEECDVTFTVYRKEFMEAICFIMNSLPLYKSSSSNSEKIESDYDFFNNLVSNVNSLFNKSEEAQYTASLLWKTDGRFYLRGLKQKCGLSIRDYLVENNSAIKFVNDGHNKIELHIMSNIVNLETPAELKPSLIVSNAKHRTFIFQCIQYLYENNLLDKMSQYTNTFGDGDYVSIVKDGSFKLKGIFFCGTEDEITERNTPRRRWYPECFKINGKDVYLSVDWYPGPDKNGEPQELMIPDFVKCLSVCYGSMFEYKKDEETHELWLYPSQNSKADHVTSNINNKEDNRRQEYMVPFSINTIIANIQSTGLIYAPTLIKRFAFSLMTKPFVILSGLAGSGKTQLAVAFAKAMSYDESQYRIVSVGADWTNREPLLGFPNALKKDEYVCPENGVLQLIIDAERNPERPYFLILDEMNLSYVERYFADFLSVMESHGKIALWDNPEGSVDTIPASVSLPNNLFIIGTINVDETTYMFSPKVLDRANVLEFKISVDEMIGFMAKVQKVDVNSITAKTADMGKSFVELACTKDMQNDQADCDVLGEFFKQLKSVNAEFGYRSATEIFRFISTAKSNDDTQDKMETADVLDAAIVQKLLPKLHGSRKKLDPVLKELWKLCMPKDNKEIEISQAKAENAIYKMSADKIARMYNAAQDNGFTSFAEA